VARLLLERGADPDRANQWGLTPLGAASEGGHTEVARALLAAGADVNRPSRGATPLDLASECAGAELVGLLLDAGGRARAGSAEPRLGEALAAAAAAGNVATARVLLARGAPVNGESGAAAPLWAAVESGFRQSQSAEIVRVLLAAGADANAAARDRGGFTPLMAACRRADAEVVSLLLEAGADWRARDDRGGDWRDWAGLHLEGKTLPFVTQFLKERGLSTP
jgi:ankyrin repeat protein